MSEEIQQLKDQLLRLRHKTGAKFEDDERQEILEEFDNIRFELTVRLTQYYISFCS